jgi:hypothetical protein
MTAVYAPGTAMRRNSQSSLAFRDVLLCLAYYSDNFNHFAAMQERRRQELTG